jgi:hypothetical protein
MKRFAQLIIVAAVLGTLSWALWRGFTHHRESGKDAPAEGAPAAQAEKEQEHGNAGVSLEKEKWEGLGIELAGPEKTELAPRRVAYGRVLDPTPLVTLDGDLAAVEAAIAASRAEFERTQKLLAAGENTSRKIFETAEAQFRADEIKADNLRRQAALQWGSTISAGDPAKRRAFVEALVRGETALVRADLLPGDTVTDAPRAARLLVLGREQQPIETENILPAADADPRTQAQGFIILVEKPPFALRPGMALTAWLELPEKPRAGFLVPRSAVLRHDGRTWVFVQAEEEEKFIRKPIVLDSPLEKGWFIGAEDGGLEADDRVVVTGPQILLSEEMKAAAGTAEPD